jgi:hypothetical protein
MDKRKFVVWSAVCSLFSFGTAYTVAADVETENGTDPLHVKDIILPEKPLKNMGQMPNFEPNQNIDYKILRMKVDPNIDYKIIRTMSSAPYYKNHQIPEFRPDTPFKISPPGSKPYFTPPNVMPPKQEPPKNK